jgi:thymidylate synthase (FAD)
MFEEMIKVYKDIKYFENPCVKLVSISTPIAPEIENTLQIAEFAARGCYNSLSCLGVDTENFLKKLSWKGHNTIWETIHVGVHIRGCSRVFTHQIITHRHLSKLQFSTRYNGDFCFVLPIGISNSTQEKLLEEYCMSRGAYKRIQQVLQGTTKKNQKEYARYVLPLGVEAPIYLSGNVHAWRDVFSTRLQKDVSPETYNIVLKIYKEMEKLIPTCVQDLAETGEVDLDRTLINE